ncbi:MAG TPA: four helix bundle protein [Anaerolinea sp.]|nr:four helix bundle protein [Anaerolinea sp.]
MTQASSERGLAGLKVWQKAVDLAEWVCSRILPLLPADERYALSAQMRRAVQSIPANIAEGYGRYYFQEGVRFCYIARGSLEETRSHIVLARRLNYLTDAQTQDLETRLNELVRLLNGYIAFLKEKKPGANEPGLNIREQMGDYDVSEAAGESLSGSPDSLIDGSTGHPTQEERT